MMSGKAVSRAVRGHMLIDAALNTFLISEALDTHLPQDQDQGTKWCGAIVKQDAVH